eukprot:1161161-Pelagomonas_calceolata.AAC.5
MGLQAHWSPSALACKLMGLQVHWPPSALACKLISLRAHWPASPLACELMGLQVCWPASAFPCQCVSWSYYDHRQCDSPSLANPQLFGCSKSVGALAEQFRQACAAGSHDGPPFGAWPPNPHLFPVCASAANAVFLSPPSNLPGSLCSAVRLFRRELQTILATTAYLAQGNTVNRASVPICSDDVLLCQPSIAAVQSGGSAVLRQCSLDAVQSGGSAVLRQCSLEAVQSCGSAVLRQCSLEAVQS